MAKISIVVPVYNRENRLKKCVDSILNQTFKDFELILVDDGSRDSSGKICDDYAEKDTRVRVIHQENKGVSDARNAGIKCAVGEYIGFVDSDDYIDEKMYEILYSLMLEHNADITVCGVREKWLNNEILASKKGNLLVLNNQEAIRFLFIGKYLTLYASNKLYKKTFFDKVKYPSGKIYEDTVATPKIFALADKIVYTSESLYNYVRSPGSITTSEFSPKDMDIIEAGKNVLEFAKKEFPELIKEAEYRYFWSYMYVIDRMITGGISFDDNNYTQLVDFLRKNKLKILSNPYFSIKRKLGLVILMISKKVYRKIVLKNNKQAK
ncbi:MAG: glycosyltransferase family 2 protein [Acutalibacteraceae bacterium]